MKRVLGLILVAFIVASSAAVQGQTTRGAGLLAQSAGISQDEAAAQVRKTTGGRVLDVRTQVQDGVSVYIVKVLLPDGRIRIVTVGGS